MITDSIGQLVNQTIGWKPSDRAIQANSPEFGIHQQVLPHQRAHRRHDEERRDHHEPEHVLAEHRLVHQQRHQNAAADADDEHGDDKDQRIDEGGDEIRVGEEGGVVLQPDEGGVDRDQAGCSAASKNRASSPSGTIIQMKSRMTDGETRARPAVAVCCVAILVALSSRATPPVGPSGSPTAPFSACPAPASLPPSREREGGGDGEDAPTRRHRVRYATRAAGKRFSLLDVAGLLHCGFRAGLGLASAWSTVIVPGERGREDPGRCLSPMPWNSGIATNCTPV